jgi:predicted Zn-dependent protease
VTVLGRDAMLAPLQDALRDAKADEAELWVHRRRSAISRYAKNEIHQNAVADETLVQARTVVGSAVGIANANSLDPADLRRLVADACAAARESAPNADWPGLAEPAPASEPNAYDAETARADAASQADAIKRITAAVKVRGFRAAGTHQIELTEDALANTKGASAYAPSTLAYLRALVTSDTGTGWAEDLGWSTRSLDPSDVAARAIEKAALDRDRTQLPPGDYEAVFEELAVAEVLRFMSLTGLSGQTLKDGRSFMAGRFGEQVTGPRFSLWDDALDARTLAVPFDVEGTPKQRVALVEGGVAKGVVHDRQSARWFDTRSTGHAADPRRYSVGGHAGNLTMAAATRSANSSSVRRDAACSSRASITRTHRTPSARR